VCVCICLAVCAHARAHSQVIVSVCGQVHVCMSICIFQYNMHTLSNENTGRKRSRETQSSRVASLIGASDFEIVGSRSIRIIS